MGGIEDTAKDFVKSLQKYSTRIGVAWWFTNFFFRVIISAGLAKSVYSDALKEFQCNTKSPGCKEICYSWFLPMEPDRFWIIETVFVAAPSVFFVLYASAKQKRYQAEIKELKSKDYVKKSDEKYLTLQNGKELKIKKRVDYNKSNLDAFVEVVWTTELRTAFVIQLLARLFVEVIFFFLLFLIQTEQNHSWNFFSVWSVPHTYVCDHGQMDDLTLFVEIDGVQKALYSPCKTDETIYCYVNRYREKTIILLYMVIFTCISISLTVAELIFVSTKYGLGTHRPYEHKKGLARKMADAKKNEKIEQNGHYSRKRSRKWKTHATIWLKYSLKWLSLILYAVNYCFLRY